MKNKIFGSILLLVTVVLLSQCIKESELLDKYPRDAANDDHFFKNAISARQGVIGIYPAWQQFWLYQNCFMITYMDILSDDAWLAGDRLNPDRNRWQTWDITSTLGGGVPLNAEWWRGLYEGINKASWVIDKLPKSKDLEPAFTVEEQNKYIGAAKIFRALGYIYLTTLWGDVPYWDHYPEEPSDFIKAKSPKAEVLEFAIKDLQFARQWVPAKWTGSDIGLPTKAVAAGFLARAFLYAQKWDSAVNASAKAIEIATEGGFGMMDDYETVFSLKSQPNKEFIWAWPYIPQNDAGNIYSSKGIVYRGVKDCPQFIKDIFNGPGFGYAVPTRNLLEAFEAGDPRRKASMWIAGDYYCIYQGADTWAVNSKSFVTPPETTYYHQGDTVKYQNGWSFGNANTKKLIADTRGAANGGELIGYDIPVLRFAELYLYYAEALIESGDYNGGMTQLNMVRKRPSVNMPDLTATSQDDARQKLRRERRVELNMEGIRTLDLLRWGIMGDALGIGTARKVGSYVGAPDSLKRTVWQSHQTVLPIPQNEIDRNPKMTQNPGY